MNPVGCDAVVVGGGVVGASVAYHLARRAGRGVVLCEQAQPPGLGATTRSGGLLRLHHTARCDTRLAARALPLFQHWAEAVGGDCGYRRTGFAMLVDRAHAQALEANVAAVGSAGGKSEIVEAGELAARHPGLRVPPDRLVAYEPDGGYGDPAATTIALLRRGLDHGLAVTEGVHVARVVVARDRVAGVETNIGCISAPLVVLACGAWTPALAATAGVFLPVQARRIGIAHAAGDVAPGDVPIVIDDVTGTYFRPDHAGGLYFGVPTSAHMDLASHPAPLANAEVRAAAATVAALVPGMSPAAVDGTRAGFDGYTPDRRAVIGRSGPEGLYVCAGFSGGGYKMAPAVGELVAAELLDGATEELLGPYRPQRFTTGDLVESEHPYARM